MLYCGKVRICGTIYGQSIGEMWLKRGSRKCCTVVRSESVAPYTDSP